MLVLLKRTFIASNGQRFKESKPKDRPVEIPDALCDDLPKDAVRVDEDYKAAPAPPVTQTMSEAAAGLGLEPERLSAERAAIAAAEAEEEEREANAAKLAEEIKAETPTPKRGPGRPKKS